MKPNELKAELSRSEMTYQDIADALEISIVAVQRKVNGASEFKSSEIGTLREVLNLTPDRVAEIFFN